METEQQTQRIALKRFFAFEEECFNLGQGEEVENRALHSEGFENWDAKMKKSRSFRIGSNEINKQSNLFQCAHL